MTMAEKKTAGTYRRRLEAVSTGAIGKQEAKGMDELISAYIKEMKLASGLNSQRVFAAWDEVSGAARYTIGRYFRNGTLYCTIGSSVVRTQLNFQKDLILHKINDFLAADDLFVKDSRNTHFVKNIILQ